MKRLSLGFFLAAVALPACSGEDGPPSRDYRDEGTVCLTGEPGGSTTLISVVLDPCASYCDTVEASREASLADGVLELHAEGTATRPAKPRDECQTACQRVAAYCQLPSVTTGTYELHYQGEVALVQLPPARATGSRESCREPDLD